MSMFLTFLEVKPSGRVDDALGSDSTFFNVQNINLDKLHRRALAHAASLRHLGKDYIGYRFYHGRTLASACQASLKDVYFTQQELN